MNITDPNELALIRAALQTAAAGARDLVSAAIANLPTSGPRRSQALDFASEASKLEADYHALLAKAVEPTYADKLDCGHSVLGRGAVHYCGDCLERLVWEKEQALKLVAGRDASISDLCAEVKRLELEVGQLQARVDQLEDVDYRDSD